mmetsp:Transcript_37228/g.63943  ORF Transcript_37228/g.63943 Transcript_37228/m.63943 type:complete len:337 (-) Transcript_37228:175-1185(-)|eukprot:CAMPEP_0206155916 /NCGR_PEP_ID=MMETSP1474-20131121/2503_1 /ASSEMBLY_ACC=CAM_ASM_001110 /TAXON_ID=97495 /ORGANISM="Imantonia sp., Strain RCC918" /LENGTH=336 /DNA_ID=CAMNT_0053554745 /DNA_START=76 /DNA_END=1086 /DNA_ORIENTATION=-
MNWFPSLYGFREGASYSANQAKFRMEGETLICETSEFPRQVVGPWETPSVRELRARLSEPAGSAPAAGGLRFQHHPTPTGVAPLILDPANDGAVFQAASQFNCLEMVGPGVSPQRGIAIYANDPTQGPKCALACPAGTVYRNYLCHGGRGQGQQQIDCLADVGAVVGNDDGVIWTMQNGYAMPARPGAIAQLSERLAASPDLEAAVVAALRVGVHWSTQAKPPHTHRVAQVYASAVPVSYSSTPASEWDRFARVVLRGAYEATLAVGALKAREGGGRRVRVFLTALGGGAFGNRTEWIRDAVLSALEAFHDAPLDVYLVHYGTRVPSDWASVKQLQ